jgi:hypothetical protein
MRDSCGDHETASRWPGLLFLIQCLLQLFLRLVVEFIVLARGFAQLAASDATAARGVFELSVANGGVPIPEAARKRLFQPFYRGELPLSRTPPRALVRSPKPMAHNRSRFLPGGDPVHLQDEALSGSQFLPNRTNGRHLPRLSCGSCREHVRDRRHE